MASSLKFDHHGYSILSADAVLWLREGRDDLPVMNSVICMGSAASIVYQGVEYANGEFVQFHPTAMLGMIKLLFEASRGREGLDV